MFFALLVPKNGAYSMADQIWILSTDNFNFFSTIMRIIFLVNFFRQLTSLFNVFNDNVLFL